MRNLELFFNLKGIKVTSNADTVIGCKRFSWFLGKKFQWKTQYMYVSPKFVYFYVWPQVSFLIFKLKPREIRKG